MVPAWLGVSALARAAAPVRLILDTDMGGGACRDVDDVVALCRKQDPPYFGQSRLGLPQAPASLGHSAVCAALVGHTGLAFGTGRRAVHAPRDDGQRRGALSHYGARW